MVGKWCLACPERLLDLKKKDLVSDRATIVISSRTRMTPAVGKSLSSIRDEWIGGIHALIVALRDTLTTMISLSFARFVSSFMDPETWEPSDLCSFEHSIETMLTPWSGIGIREIRPISAHGVLAVRILMAT
jgi:hypothetical protein